LEQDDWCAAFKSAADEERSVVLRMLETLSAGCNKPGLLRGEVRFFLMATTIVLL